MLDIRIGRAFRLEFLGTAWLTLRLPFVGELGWLPGGLSYFESWWELRRPELA